MLSEARQEGQEIRMFDAIKRMIGSTSAGDATDEGQVLSAWAKAEGHTFKRVKAKTGTGFVVEAPEGWRVEWGASQRSYIAGKELRFRCDTGVASDVQLIMLSRALSLVLETDVFSRFTNAMQTQIDNTLPDEMRWLAMHPRVPLNDHAALARRLVVFSNAEAVARRWLDDSVLLPLEEAAGNWWTDTLVMVLTINRGMLTLRMSGDKLQPLQLKLVGELYRVLAMRLKAVALGD
ncbi:hypothetical protein [Aquabacterium parvum]|jgi:hypothetical protein|uniref:hypothetical protein n=1 Tax=Aquabacterium parvum TaxID=70584 RepID=UPI000718C7A7|nr:hypothetical protein [Aquabacterium parvum]MBU0916803.1 hypothetical protein [Gammaproteobacteria bacterium]